MSNRLPEEARCKNCPHWYKGKRQIGECNIIDEYSTQTPAFIENRGGGGEPSQAYLQTHEDFGCSLHPHWSKEPKDKSNLFGALKDENWSKEE